MKNTVDKRWPDDMVGVAAADQDAESAAQARQRRQRYIDHTLRGLRPRYLQRKAQEYLTERTNATWNDFSAHLTNKDVSYQVSTIFLIDEEQNKSQMLSLGQELKKPTNWAEGTQSKRFGRKPEIDWPKPERTTECYKVLWML